MSLAVPSQSGNEQHYESDAALTPPRAPTPQLRDSESSTERSAYEDIDKEIISTLPGQRPFREYGFYYTARHSHLVIRSADEQKTSVYFAESSVFTRGKPDVILHAVRPTTRGCVRGDFSTDEGEAGLVLGVAKFSFTSRHVRSSLGDPSSHIPIDWDELRCARWHDHSKYDFAFSGRTYSWIRTHAVADGLEDNAFRRHMSQGSYKLVDQLSGEIVAIFLVNIFKSWKKRGKLRMYNEIHERGMEVVTVLTCASISEKARRRAERRAGAGAGANGGRWLKTFSSTATPKHKQFC